MFSSVNIKYVPQNYSDIEIEDYKFLLQLFFFFLLPLCAKGPTRCEKRSDLLKPHFNLDISPQSNSFALWNVLKLHNCGICTEQIIRGKLHCCGLKCDSSKDMVESCPQHL